MPATINALDDLDDFDLLNPNLDAVNVNGASCLYLGKSGAGDPIVLRRVDEQTAVEMNLNPQQISFMNGRVRAVGEGVVISRRPSLYCEQTYSQQKFEWKDRTYFEETRQRLAQLTGAGL